MSLLIIVFVSTITSFVCGSNISFNGYLPSSLSANPSTIWFPSLISSIVNPSTVPQSCSLTIISCETSTSLLVKYPESAVLKAVSESPLRAPCDDMKYSNASRPSRKHDLIGISTALPVVLAISPRIPAICLNWFMLPRAPDLTIIYIGFKSSKFSSIALLTSFVAFSQILTTDWYLSSSVIKPLLYWFLTFSTCLSASAKMSFLESGTFTSATENVIPANVEYLKPNALI